MAKSSSEKSINGPITKSNYIAPTKLKISTRFLRAAQSKRGAAHPTSSAPSSPTSGELRSYCGTRLNQTKLKERLEQSGNSFIDGLTNRLKRKDRILN